MHIYIYIQKWRFCLALFSRSGGSMAFKPRNVLYHDLPSQMWIAPTIQQVLSKQQGVQSNNTVGISTAKQGFDQFNSKQRLKQHDMTHTHKEEDLCHLLNAKHNWHLLAPFHHELAPKIKRSKCSVFLESEKIKHQVTKD